MAFNPATALLMLQGAGAGMSAIGSYFDAARQRSTLRYRANIADINAGMARTAAQQTLRAGRREGEAQRLRTAAVKGTQRAAMAANNIALGEGSAGRVEASTDLIGEIDAETIAANALRASFGYRTEAVGYQNQALMDRADAGATSPLGAGFTSLLGSATGIARDFYMLRRVGALPSGGATAPGTGRGGASNPSIWR